MKTLTKIASRVMLVGALSLFTAGTALATPPIMPPRPEPEPRPIRLNAPKIQIALLLDTSGSMSGLIEQAKTQLWKVVNEFATAKRRGVRPILEVALYEYGKSSIPASEGYIRMITPLSTDLDRVSEELFALRTNGGDEYCGQVIRKAVNGLAWSPRKHDLKMIFIAGNEPFTQGPVDYRMSVKSAIRQSITVNTIHCGDYQTGVRTGWKDGAMLADGSYMHIDHNRRVVHIESPFDDEIARLGRDLNKTYLGYGARGKKAKMRQEAQDDNASGAAAGVAMERAVTKASAFYDNSSWDLVDAVAKGKADLDKLSDGELPAALRGMSKAERKAHLAKMAKKRSQLQAKINKLNADRKKFVSQKRAEMAEKEGKDTLDSAMIKTMRAQAAKKAFTFK